MLGMAALDKLLDDVLDKMGVPQTQSGVVSNITYTSERKTFKEPGARPTDYSLLVKRKAIFQKGSLVKTKKPFRAFVSKKM